MRHSVCAVFALVFVLTLGWSRLVNADAVTDWNENAGETAKAACLPPDEAFARYRPMLREA